MFTRTKEPIKKYKKNIKGKEIYLIQESPELRRSSQVEKFKRRLRIKELKHGDLRQINNQQQQENKERRRRDNKVTTYPKR